MTLLDLTPRTATAPRLDALPVVVIGAGPIGLAAAANLVERGIDVVVLEAGEEPAAAVRRWGHIRLFSPWRHLVDPASRRLLEASGWTEPDADAAPTGRELVDAYVAPLAELKPLRSRIRYGSRVLAVAREGMDRTRSAGRETTPFVVRYATADGVVELTARAVIDASGTFDSPNPLGSTGLDPLGAPDLGDRLVHPLPDVLGIDRARFAGRHTTVVGAGHSAANTLLALATLAESEPGTRITWLIRNDSAVRVSSSADDELGDRAALGSRVDTLVHRGIVEKIDAFEIATVERRAGGVRLIGMRRGAASVHDTDLVV